MIIPYGTVTYGQAHTVKERFSVGTDFFHIFWAPLIPTGSYAIFDQSAPKDVIGQMRAQHGARAAPDADATADAPNTGADVDTGNPDEEQVDQELRVSIPLSGTSVLLGYLRGWGFWVTLFCGFLGGMLWLMSGDDPEAGAVYPGFLWTALGGFVVAMGSYYGPWNTASADRAVALCEAIGMAPATLPEELRPADALDERP
jgi:hypothetical protein